MDGDNEQEKKAKVWEIKMKDGRTSEIFFRRRIIKDRLENIVNFSIWRNGLISKILQNLN